MMAALHQQARAADRERPFDLLEDHRLRQQVPLAHVAGATVERAEVAVGDADVRVVEIAIDDERDAVRVVLAVSDRVCRPADRDEVAGAQQGDRFVVRDPLAVECLLEDRRGPRLGEGAHATAAPFVETKRSSGTVSSRSWSRASSRKV